MNSSPLTSSSPRSPPDSKKKAKPFHQRLVLTDPVAFRYLEDDSSTKVIERRARLEGYDCYIVEQWACSRTHPTFVITTYNGDPANGIYVGVLSVPTDERAWSPKLRVYLNALAQYHARRKETPLGMLMITDMSAFPSSLTVVSVPDGDVKKHREDFFVNENLKRLQCSGRVGIQLAAPAGATVAKFHQLYRTHAKLPLYSAVIELVKLCQLALMLFGRLQPGYADGLLCDVTEKAINGWWNDLGIDLYNAYPTDGILGPTTVAALLGTLVGARNRLHAYGAPVAKDVFDIESTKRGIAYFQKTQKIPKTRRLDASTLRKLQSVTAKAASSEGRLVPRALKSTVAELSGKGGEMIVDLVGARDKAGIAEIETTNIDRFVDLVSGERAKWLWHGKAKKNATKDKSSKGSKDEGLIFRSDDQGGFTWSGRRKDSSYPKESVNHQNEGLSYGGKRPSAVGEDEDPEEVMDRSRDEGKQERKGDTTDDGLRYTISKKVVPFRATEARAGIERLKDAVTLRGYRHRSSKLSNDISFTARYNETPAVEQRDRSRTASSNNDNQAPKRQRSPRDRGATSNKGILHSPAASLGANTSPNPQLPQYKEPELEALRDNTDDQSMTGTVTTIAHGTGLRAIDPDDRLGTPSEPLESIPQILRRTLSTSYVQTTRSIEQQPTDRRPRHLSFSLAEDIVSKRQRSNEGTEEDDSDDPRSRSELVHDPRKALAKELALAERARHLRYQLTALSVQAEAFTAPAIDAVSSLASRLDHSVSTVHCIHLPLQETITFLQEDCQDLAATSRTHTTELIKDVEVLSAKLEYELNSLGGKVQDMEEGVGEFQRAVDAVEIRVRELEGLSEREGKREGWVNWLWRALLGVGGRPEESKT